MREHTWFIGSGGEAEINFFRREKLCRQDYLDYLKNKAKSGDIVVLQLTLEIWVWEIVQKLIRLPALKVNWISENCFTYCSVQIFKILFLETLFYRIWFSAQDYKVWCLLLNPVVLLIFLSQKSLIGNDLYWRYTSFEKAFRQGRPFNILHDL